MALISEFTGGNPGRIIITPRNAVVHSLLCDLNLVGTKFRILKQLLEDFENIVQIAFQA